MWNSVSRALAYGWNVGFSLVEKMSDKIFDTKSVGGEDSYFVSDKTRQKWDADTSPVKVDAVVLLETPQTPPLHWPLGVIEKVYPGLDNITRVVEVKTKSGLFKRPVSKTYPLPQQ